MTDKDDVLLEEFRKSNLTLAVNSLLSKRATAENGRLPHGALRSTVLMLKKAGVDTDTEHLRYLLKKELNKPPNEEESTTANSRFPLTEISIVNGDNNGTSTGTASTLTGDSSLSQRSNNKGGRPVGTTIVMSQKKELQKTNCVNDITKIYDLEKKRCIELGLPLEKYFLKDLIIRKWNQYDLDPSTMVSTETIRSRIKRGVVVVRHPGREPVLPANVEKVIVDTVLYMAKIRRPLSLSEVVALANSLIEGTEYEEKVKQFHVESGTILDATTPLLRQGWWRGFNKRHGDALVIKKGERFAKDRAEWSTEANIKQMYDQIYANMIEAGIAHYLPQAVSMNGNGDIVENITAEKNFTNLFETDPSRPLGLPCDVELLHPQHIIFFDETGCNTNQKDDGNNGGEKFVCGRGTTPKRLSATQDKHFTLLGLTAATGEPVLCVVIFASDRPGVVANWATGIDRTVIPVYAEDGTIALDERNFGANKYFPSGPTCYFRGIELPCLTLSSPKGSITSELLVEIVGYLDQKGVYDRVNGPDPFLLVDGHASRLDAEFVDYVTNPEHTWHVNLGIPYATSYWQVGDSSEQNGHFKQLLGVYKGNLVSFKIKHGIPIGLTGEDISYHL